MAKLINFGGENNMASADEIIKKLKLEPHTEGEYFRETFRDDSGGDRAWSTAIF